MNLFTIEELMCDISDISDRTFLSKLSASSFADASFSLSSMAYAMFAACGWSDINWWLWPYEVSLYLAQDFARLLDGMMM